MPKAASRTYFGKDTELDIIRYNSLTDEGERSQLYEQSIHPALNKLVENVIHKYKFYYYESTYEDLKHDTVLYLHERLSKYSQTKGKAFSYFTIVARNYLIVRTTENYESQVNRDPLLIIDERRNIATEVMIKERQDLLSDFMKEWSTWGIDHVERLFARERDQRIADAVFVLFRNCENIDNYNKKALYILIREQADVRTQYITRVINRLREIFNEMSEDYLENGLIDWDYYANVHEEIIDD